MDSGLLFCQPRGVHSLFQCSTGNETKRRFLKDELIDETKYVSSLKQMRNASSRKICYLRWHRIKTEIHAREEDMKEGKQKVRTRK